jgi:hypothetical protein
MIKVGDRVVITNSNLSSEEDVVKTYKVLSTSIVPITEDVELQNLQLEGLNSSNIVTNLDVRKV